MDVGGLGGTSVTGTGVSNARSTGGAVQAGAGATGVAGGLAWHAVLINTKHTNTILIPIQSSPAACW